MLGILWKGLGAFSESSQSVGAKRNVPCPPVSKSRGTVSPSIKLILRRCDLRQECRSVLTTRVNMFFRFGFYGRIKVYFP